MAIAFVVVKLYNFKISRTSKKLYFGLLLGDLSWLTTPNQVRFVQKFHQWCSASQSITYVTVFDIVLKIPKMEPKNLFLGLFSEVFRPCPATSFAPHLNLLSNERSHKDTQLCHASSSLHLWFSSYKFSKVFVAMEQPWIGPFWGFFRP